MIGGFACDFYTKSDPGYVIAPVGYDSETYVIRLIFVFCARIYPARSNFLLLKLVAIASCFDPHLLTDIYWTLVLQHGMGGIDYDPIDIKMHDDS